MLKKRLYALISPKEIDEFEQTFTSVLASFSQMFFHDQR